LGLFFDFKPQAQKMAQSSQTTQSISNRVNPVHNPTPPILHFKKKTKQNKTKQKKKKRKKTLKNPSLSSAPPPLSLSLFSSSSSSIQTPHPWLPFPHLFSFTYTHTTTATQHTHTRRPCFFFFFKIASVSSSSSSRWSLLLLLPHFMMLRDCFVQHLLLLTFCIVAAPSGIAFTVVCYLSFKLFVCPFVIVFGVKWFWCDICFRADLFPFKFVIVSIRLVGFWVSFFARNLFDIFRIQNR